jgi:hypothetical protein
VPLRKRRRFDSAYDQCCLDRRDRTALKTTELLHQSRVVEQLNPATVEERQTVAINFALSLLPDRARKLANPKVKIFTAKRSASSN